MRWVAIRHADDHVHIVALLARQDGGKAFAWRDFYQVADACHAAEQRYGLTPTPPCDRTAARRPTRAEEEKAGRHRRAEPPRVTLRRHAATAAAAAAASRSSSRCWSRWPGAGQAPVQHRDPGQVTGYAIGLDGDTGRDGQPVWYGGGKLAADLTLPKLRARWHPARAGAGPRRRRGGGTRRGTTPPAPPHGQRRDRGPAGHRPGRRQRHRLGRRGRAAGRRGRAGQPGPGAGRGRLRPGRPPAWGRLPPPTPAGSQLRSAARLLSRPRRSPGTGRWPTSRSWCGWWRWPRRSASCAPPSSVPPRPPPRSRPPASCAPPRRRDLRGRAAARPPRGWRPQSFPPGRLPGCCPGPRRAGPGRDGRRGGPRGAPGEPARSRPAGYGLATAAIELGASYPTIATRPGRPRGNCAAPVTGQPGQARPGPVRGCPALFSTGRVAWSIRFSPGRLTAGMPRGRGEGREGSRAHDARTWRQSCRPSLLSLPGAGFAHVRPDYARVWGG